MVNDCKENSVMQKITVCKSCNLTLYHGSCVSVTKKIFYFCSFSFAHLDVSRTDDLAKRASP